MLIIKIKKKSERERVRGLASCGFKTYYKAAVTKTVHSWREDTARSSKQKCPERDPPPREADFLQKYKDNSLVK